MTSSLCEDSQEPRPRTHALVGPVWMDAGMSGFTSWSAANRSTRVALFQPAPSKQPFNCGSGVSRRRSCVVVGRVRATSAPMAIPATNSLRRAGASSASLRCAAAPASGIPVRKLFLMDALALRADSAQRCVLIAYNRGACKLLQFAGARRSGQGQKNGQASALDILEIHTARTGSRV